MKRRTLCHALPACAAVAAGLVARAARAQPQRMARIGWLTSAEFATWEHRAVFVEAMRERGWVEGVNYVIEPLSYEGRPERLAAAAAELVQRRPDLLVAGGTPLVAALQKATQSIPIVFVGAADPVGSGFVASLARPAGNATGLGGLGERLFSKNLEVLKLALPAARRVGLAWNPTFGLHQDFMPEMEQTAAHLGIELRKVPLRAPDELGAAVAAVAREAPDGAFLAGQPWFARHAATIATACLQQRLPAISINEELARAGLLLSYGWRGVDEVKRLPHYIDRILRGALPGEIPVEQPTRFYLTVNRRSARLLGLTLPQPLLLRADEVIE